jgi:hypothetical protein
MCYIDEFQTQFTKEITMPLQIAVLNESTVIQDVAIQQMIPAFSDQWNKDLETVWGVQPADLVFFSKGQAPPAGSWWVIFLDDSDQANALAYHDLTNDGFPLSKVFVKTIQADNASVSVGATHEICEMAVDPWLNSAYQDPSGVFWAGEICDPVEDDQYGYTINGIRVTDFVTPNWFAHKNAQENIDFQNKATAPFQILDGGYAQKFDPNSGWIQVTGSRAKASRRAAAAYGSRRERRARNRKGWKTSSVSWGVRAKQK